MEPKLRILFVNVKKSPHEIAGGLSSVPPAVRRRGAK